ncbi:sigma-70 family RNA polymerase sigma factor [bacterium]|nr:sigma-70 family RNA polymerase sigma factor [bacterium]
MNRTGAAVGRVARAAATGVTEVPDLELLRRFAAANDQGAFAALVERHGRMVYGACRRLLPAAEDAEDACQATFLILARKAGGRWWQASVAGWLYATARRVAARVRRSAARRAAREAGADAPTAPGPLDVLTGRELLAVLDEELTRLPARYREPLVLCYLDGLSRGEAAHRLAVPVATVKTRLERGRRRLGAALAGRGVAPGAGFLALASIGGACIPRLGLTGSILAAVGGAPTPTVAALAREGVMNGATAVVATLTTAAIIVLAVVRGAGEAVLTDASSVGNAVAPMAGRPAPQPPVAAAGDARFQAAVTAARGKAVKYLVDRQTADGHWEGLSPNTFVDMAGGPTALATLALLEAGQPPAHPAVRKAVDYLAGLPPKKTYVVGLQTRVLAAANPKAHAARIQANADWLVGRAIGLDEGKLTGWSYPSGQLSDASNTHFAVFGLHAAARAGAKVDGKMWEAVRGHYVRTRTPGGWKYLESPLDPTPTYSMTVAALVGLATADEHTRPTAEGREAFEQGLRTVVSMPTHPPKSVGYQWLVTAELGRLIRTPVLKSGDREVRWYRDGAEALVKDQRPDGSWVPGRGVDADPVLGTAFGLYFLGPPPGR